MNHLIIATTIALLSVTAAATGQTSDGGSIGSETSTQTQGSTKNDVNEPVVDTSPRVLPQGGAGSAAGESDSIGTSTSTQTSGSDQDAVINSVGVDKPRSTGANTGSNAGQSKALGTSTSSQTSDGN